MKRQDLEHLIRAAGVDIAVSKLIAGRERDLHFVRQLVQYGLVSIPNIESVFTELPKPQSEQVAARVRLL